MVFLSMPQMAEGRSVISQSIILTMKFKISIASVLLDRLDRPDLDQEEALKIIEDYTPEKAFQEVCGWYLGDPSWGPTLLEWARDCGVKL